MATDVLNGNLDEELNNTEIGSFISKFKIPVIVLIVLGLIGILGYGVYSSSALKTKAAYADQAYSFEKGILADYLDKEKSVEASKLVSEFTSLKKSVGNFSGLFTLGLRLADELISKSEFALAGSVLSSIESTVNTDYMKFFFSLRKATLLENEGKIEEAIAELNSIVSLKILESKIYLDLGRLYKKSGDTAKAKSSYHYVIENDTQVELKRLAKIYLTELK